MNKILKLLIISIIISCGNNQNNTADNKVSYATEVSGKELEQFKLSMALV